jgi:hypothetical protein
MGSAMEILGYSLPGMSSVNYEAIQIAIGTIIISPINAK